MRDLLRGPVLAGMAAVACCATVTGAAHPGVLENGTAPSSATQNSADWPPWGQGEDDSAEPWTEAEDEVVRLVNQARPGLGCDTLEVNDVLADAAREHSQSEARGGGGFGGPWFFGGHSSATDRAHDKGYSRVAGEIVASGFESAEDAVEAWTGRHGHTGVLGNCDAEDIGVGVVHGDDGPYWTVILGYGS